MKYYLSYLLLFFFSTVWANCIPLSPEMHVKKRYIASTPTFDIDAYEKKVGVITRKPISWTTQYLLEDEDQQQVASAYKESEYSFEIEDENGHILGTIQEIPISTPTYEVFSSKGIGIAKAKLNGWHTKWDITDYEETHTLATLEHSNLCYSGEWTFQIQDREVFIENQFHPHLSLFLIAFQANWQSLDDLEPFLKKELFCELETHAADFEQATPDETDFLFVEHLTMPCFENQTLYDALKCSLNFLNSDFLNISQKAALYFMLVNRLKSLCFKA
ncbi:MAG: hypothetical protein WAM28_00315 [Chlamydiales bacterium]